MQRNEPALNKTIWYWSEAYISFDKLIRDSKQRNKVLFEKLNLPTA
jgi:hypothetical protein